MEEDSRDLLITSVQNPQVKAAVALRQRRSRDRTGRFLIEGYRELLRACDGGQGCDKLFFCRELFLGENEDALIRRLRGCGAEVIECSERVFQKLSYRDRPDGLLGVGAAQQRTVHDLEKLLEGCLQPFLVIAEAIEKPGNLGTILRSSDAAGVDALIVCDRCTDVHNPNVVRASVGTLFTVPVFEMTSTECLELLSRRGIAVVAATPAGDKIYTGTDLSGAVAVAVGTEQLGLSDLMIEAATQKVKIPMAGIADSLNVAMATTLLLFEVQRQRG